jgi:serine/threonine-protein kinase
VESVPAFEGCHLVERVESGPVADLFRAVQQPLGRPVLIKALSTSILPSSPFAATLEREARLLAELHHPNILHVYDFVRRDDRMWLVLEDVDGFSVHAVLGKTPKLDQRAATAIALEVARALEHAHQRGIIHRDVQPRNVLISRRGDVKLVNFAIAVDERLPSLPELLDGRGNPAAPAYMSPEQILGEPADPRSDLFSLGVVLYEMLTGSRPFEGPDDRTTTQRIRHDPPPPLAQAAPHVPPALERAVYRCLEKLPTDRFRSAGELTRALEDILVTTGADGAATPVLSVLHDAGFVAPPKAPRDTAAAKFSHVAAPSVARIVAVLALFGTLIAAGGAAIQLASGRSSAQGPARVASRLELVPAEAAYLRVVAEPWAHVVIDGQQVATTPHARPIPLPPGTHYVRLEHPDAPVERRTIELVAGETTLLDVKLSVAVSETVTPEPAGGAAEPTAADAGWSP